MEFKIPDEQILELRKEILITIQRNPFPDIALQAISNMLLGFACVQLPNLNNADHCYWMNLAEKIPVRINVDNNTAADLPLTENIDDFAITTTHLPIIDITLLTSAETLLNYVISIGNIVEQWMSDPYEKLVAGTLRLHWVLSPEGRIHGILYSVVKKVGIVK